MSLSTFDLVHMLLVIAELCIGNILGQLGKSLIHMASFLVVVCTCYDSVSYLRV